MTIQHGCDNTQSQFLTRETLFTSHCARVHVFDGITHDTSAKLLNTVSLLPLRSYFKAPVLLVGDVANYYCVNAITLKKVLAFCENKQELKSDGMLVLQRNDIEGAHEQLGTSLYLKSLVLLPPRAILKLALFLPATPSVAATLNVLWDYVLEHGLNNSTPSNWRKTFERENVRTGYSKLYRGSLQAKQKQFKDLGLYPYVQHFGHQGCKETWDSLEEYNTRKGEFPPPRGSVFWIA